MTDQNREGYWLGSTESAGAHVFLQHGSFTSALGGLVPKTIPLHEVQKVLDVGCGAGGWAIDMLKHYPSVHVTGIDHIADSIRDAQRYTQMSHIRQITFQHMDVTTGLTFENNTFDLVHMRSASPFIRPETWPTVMQELTRIIRPGGWLTVIDYEQGPTSSEAFNAITNVVMQAVRLTNSSLAPSSLSIGAAVRLYGFFLNAYLLDIDCSFHAVDFGPANNRDARDFVEGILGVASNFKPLLGGLNIIDLATYDSLIARAREELTQPAACGYGFLVAVVGRKND